MLYAKFLFKFFLCLNPAAAFTLKIFSDIYIVCNFDKVIVFLFYLG